FEEDAQVWGPNTSYQVVRGDLSDKRDWLEGQPVCPLLAQHHIAHVGVMNARSPFRITRNDQSGTFLLSCIQGRGRVLADGGWHEVSAGQTCLLPPFARNAFGCLLDEPWQFVWVRYLESRERSPVLSANSPVFSRHPNEPLLHAITGLWAESASQSSPAHMQIWCDLIQAYVMRFAQPHHGDPRLWKLWKKVETRIDWKWSLTELAHEACVSEEHLRRLCRKELGRSPMQHVTFLRMKRAAHLLATTDEKVETVCREVGYENPFTFSNTFKKWAGRRPSEHRRT
ncbi:MAG: AraC family transcriptional regulator, partial [Verrucomicrobiales bacterium]